jgi:hypothetical protein
MSVVTSIFIKMTSHIFTITDFMFGAEFLVYLSEATKSEYFT